MMKSVVPMLRYRDARAAIVWLCSAFGFETLMLVPGPAGAIQHARLARDTTMIMLASLHRDGALEDRYRVPSELGAMTQSLLVHVEDPDAVCRSAKSAGAEILVETADFEFGVLPRRVTQPHPA